MARTNLVTYVFRYSGAECRTDNVIVKIYKYSTVPVQYMF